MGIGCRRDPLEANVWYVRAADHGDERAKHRIAAIRAAASGADPNSAAARRLQKNGTSSHLYLSIPKLDARTNRLSIYQEKNQRRNDSVFSDSFYVHIYLPSTPISQRASASHSPC